MKKFLPVLLIALAFASCSKDVAEVLPGNWDTSDGGTITFNNDNTGTTSGSDFFEQDFGSGPVEDFTWSLSGDNLTMDFVEGSNSASMEMPVEVKRKNKVVVGFKQGIFDLSVTLTK